MSSIQASISGSKIDSISASNLSTVGAGITYHKHFSELSEQNGHLLVRGFGEVGSSIPD